MFVRERGFVMTDFGKVIKGINEKDEKAWKVLFESFYASLCRHSVRILKDEQGAADVVQETLIRLWNSNICFESSKGMVVYLYRSVTNISLKYLRDRNVEDERLKKWQEEEEMSEENFSSVVEEEVFRKLRDLLNRLPEERREIMLMSLEGMSGEEIASRLGITIHTVKQQKYRAYKFIRQNMGKHWPIVLIFFIS